MLSIMVIVLKARMFSGMVPFEAMPPASASDESASPGPPFCGDLNM